MKSNSVPVLPSNLLFKLKGLNPLKRSLQNSPTESVHNT
jgi:hypothetical protein